MATASLPEARARRDVGRLANNYILVHMLQAALSGGESSCKTIPGLLRDIIRDDAWREWINTDTGDEVRWNAAEFRPFLESPRPRGCHTPIAIVRRLVAGTGVNDDFERLVRGEPGGANNPEPSQDSVTGKFAPTVNRNNIPVDGAPIDDVSPDVLPHPRVRDYARESKQGTSVSYALRRLGKSRPDLLERVRTGDMSPHAACVEAGFRPKAITIPDDPIAGGRRLLRHFRGDRLDALIDVLRAARDAAGVAP